MGTLPACGRQDDMCWPGIKRGHLLLLLCEEIAKLDQMRKSVSENEALDKLVMLNNIRKDMKTEKAYLKNMHICKLSVKENLL